MSGWNHYDENTERERERNNNKTSLSFTFILMSTLTWITWKEPEFEINNNRAQFRQKRNMKIIENEKCWRRPRWKWEAVKKKNRVNRNTNIFSKKTFNVQKKIMHVQSCFIANEMYCCFYHSRNNVFTLSPVLLDFIFSLRKL